MKCKNCGNEIVSGKLCDKCRKADYRKRKAGLSQDVPNVPKAGTNVPKAADNKTGTKAGTMVKYKLIPDVKVYGRPAVQYNIAEPWRLRPEPENESDKPILNNRGRFQRQDKSKYQIDSTGSMHGLTGNQVYQDIGLNLQV